MRPATITGSSSTNKGGIAWLGSASVGITSDRMGRRKAIAFGCAWGVLGGALMAGAAHVAMCKFFTILHHRGYLELTLGLSSQ